MNTKARSFVIAKRTAIVLGVITGILTIFFGIAHFYARLVWLGSEYEYYVKLNHRERNPIYGDGQEEKTFWNYSPIDMDDFTMTHTVGALLACITLLVITRSFAVYGLIADNDDESFLIVLLKVSGIATTFVALSHIGARIAGLHPYYDYYSHGVEPDGFKSTFHRIDEEDKTFWNYSPDGWGDVLGTHATGGFLVLIAVAILFGIGYVVFEIILKDEDENIIAPAD